MDENQKKEIENIFRCSTSSSELFDAFHFLLSLRVRDLELYKTLLANNVLSDDETKMFTEKLCEVFNEWSYELLMWSAQVFENKTTNYTGAENAFSYFIKAYNTLPIEEESLLKIINLYNYEINLPINNSIINFVNDNLYSVKKKSLVYKSLAELYGKLGNIEKSKTYNSLAEKSHKEESSR